MLDFKNSFLINLIKQIPSRIDLNPKTNIARACRMCLRQSAGSRLIGNETLAFDSEKREER
jgi:hypothetical protein